VLDKFKTCPGFEDIENNQSTSLKIFESDYLKSSATTQDTLNPQLILLLGFLYGKGTPK
jgi:hypothetical protein